MTPCFTYRFLVLTALLTFYSGLVQAQTVQAARPIKINTVVTADDLKLSDDEMTGAFSRIHDAVGLETRKTLYPGRPVMVGDLGPVTVIDRNQLVQLVFKSGTLEITADGRALGRAAIGQRVRVMNSNSRLTVTGVVRGPALVEVQN